MMLDFPLQDPVVVPRRTNVCSKSFVLLLEFYLCEICDFSGGKSQARVGATGKSTAKGKTTSCFVLVSVMQSEAVFFSCLRGVLFLRNDHCGSSRRHCKYSRNF